MRRLLTLTSALVTTTSIRVPRLVAVVVAVAVLATSCSVDASRIATGQAAGDAAQAAIDAGVAALPAVGPAPGSSHWHAAYVVRICDDVLAPFDDRNESLGIHTHGDGLIHVHPFFPQIGFEDATLGSFADVVGLGLADGELTLPGGGVWRDGDDCNGRPGRVYVDRWSGPSPDSSLIRHFTDLDQIRFTADRELYQIAFAPEGSPPVIPPSWGELDQVSAPIPGDADPWVRVDPDANADTAYFATVDDVTSAPCTAEQLADAVLSGSPACYSLGERQISRDDAVVTARAVQFNRQPAVDLVITAAFRAFIVEPFVPGNPAMDQGVVLAVVVDDEVITAPLLQRPSASDDRLILAGGLSADSAARLAAVLNG